MSLAADRCSALHVLTLTPFFPSEGNEVNGCFIAEPIQQLKHCGVESSVIAAAPVYRRRKRSSSLSAADWVRYPQVPGNLGLSSAGTFLYARLLRQVQQLHQTKPIDVIHAHAALPCGHAARLLSLELKIPFIVTVHGLDVWNTCYTSGISAAWRKRASIDVYRAARTVICISAKVQNILKVSEPDEICSKVVYNGVDTNLFCPASVEIESSDPSILIVGNVQRSKGHELVLRAVANLRSSFPRLQCRIIGEGPHRAEFETLALELGIAPQVQFVGRNSRAEVAEAMRRCSVFALPSRNEGLGCVYLEAMSCGKPAIGCRGQGIDEVIVHGTNGWLIPSGGRQENGLTELVEALSAMLASSEFRARIGAAARQTILEKFTLAHQAQNLAEIYRCVIA